jgi:hypothetical protein
MNINILFYGNCQVAALYNTLILNDTTYKIILCHETNLSESEFLEEIKSVQVIITQPISNDYRNKSYLSTKYLLDNISYNTIIIIFPSIYFHFYYFDKFYKFYNNNLLRDPSDYHYKGIVETYNLKESSLYFIENYLNNPNLITRDELLKISEESILELIKREKLIRQYRKTTNFFIINISKFIKHNYLNYLLFWSVNHPTKYIFHFISEKILDILNIKFNTTYISTNNIDYNIDTLEFNEKCLLYKSLENIVFFDLEQYAPRLYKFNETDTNKIVQYYLDAYTNLNTELL